LAPASDCGYNFVLVSDPLEGFAVSVVVVEEVVDGDLKVDDGSDAEEWNYAIGAPQRKGWPESPLT
jgi:hypothetical protein